MTRPIKFRAKPLDGGEWVYGGGVTETGMHTFLLGVTDLNDLGRTFQMVEVRPDTVGQYTGLVDRAGVEVFEGDIIEKTQWSKPYSDSRKPCRVRYEVRWREQFSSDNEHNNKALADDPSCFNRETGFYGKELWNERGYDHHSWSCFAACEVIGSIHDNPELLTGGGEL